MAKLEAHLLTNKGPPVIHASLLYDSSSPWLCKFLRADVALLLYRA